MEDYKEGVAFPFSPQSQSFVIASLFFQVIVLCSLDTLLVLLLSFASSSRLSHSEVSQDTTTFLITRNTFKMAEITNGAFKHDNSPVPNVDRVLPLFSLKGRTAIVSGAGAGIGLAVAEALAEAGANVAIWYNSNKQAEESAATIAKTYGVKCAYFPSLLYP